MDVTLDKGLYRVASWPDGTVLYRMIGEWVARAFGGSAAREKSESRAMFALMTGDDLIATVILDLDDDDAKGPILQHIVMNEAGHPAHHMAYRNKLLWVTHTVFDIPFLPKIGDIVPEGRIYLTVLEQMAMPRFAMSPEQEQVLRSDIAVSERTGNPKMQKSSDFLQLGHIAMQRMSALARSMEFTAPGVPKGVASSSTDGSLHGFLKLGFHTITSVRWYPDPRLKTGTYALHVSPGDNGPYATGDNLVDLLVEHFFLTEPFESWLDRNQVPGDVAYDDELYRLMDEDVPATWGSRDFSEWAKSMGFVHQGSVSYARYHIPVWRMP